MNHILMFGKIRSIMSTGASAAAAPIQGLSNTEQAILMFLAFVLPPVAAQIQLIPGTGAGLAGSFLAGIIAFLKEYKG